MVKTPICASLIASSVLINYEVEAEFCPAAKDTLDRLAKTGLERRTNFDERKVDESTGRKMVEGFFFFFVFRNLFSDDLEILFMVRLMCTA